MSEYDEYENEKYYYERDKDIADLRAELERVRIERDKMRFSLEALSEVFKEMTNENMILREVIEESTHAIWCNQFDPHKTVMCSCGKKVLDSVPLTAAKAERVRLLESVAEAADEMSREQQVSGRLLSALFALEAHDV